MTREVTKTGLRFRVDEDQPAGDWGGAGFWDWFESETWEPDTAEALSLYLDSDTVYVDVGAWIGDTVMLGACRAHSVIAFEPDPTARAVLERNLSLNPLIENVDVRGEALTDRSGPGSLVYVGEAGDSLTQLARVASRGGMVRQLDVREFLAQEPSLAGHRLLMKLDVEGSEYEVIPAMRDFIRRFRPDLLISFHPNMRFDKRSLIHRLSSGFHVLVKNWRVLRAVRPYRYHLLWDQEANQFRDQRAMDTLRRCLPLPRRASFLIGAFLFTDHDRRRN